MSGGVPTARAPAVTVAGVVGGAVAVIAPATLVGIVAATVLSHRAPAARRHHAGAAGRMMTVVVGAHRQAEVLIGHEPLLLQALVDLPPALAVHLALCDLVERQRLGQCAARAGTRRPG